jgi:hypothetical protein
VVVDYRLEILDVAEAAGPPFSRDVNVVASRSTIPASFHKYLFHKKEYISSPHPGSPFRKVAPSSIRNIVGIEDSWHDVLLQVSKLT